MTNRWVGGSLAEEANDIFAPAYDDFNNRYRNTQWTDRLLRRAKSAGLEGNQLLDVACGTGHTAIPMLRRGWRVTGCDVSAEMLSIAREKIGDGVRLEQADMRDLPVFGTFDLVWALNDPLNYLLSDEELRATVKGLAANLGPNGILIFDVNTAETYRTFFAETLEVTIRGRHLVWTGLNDPASFRPGGKGEATFEAIGESGSAHVHHQRHFPFEQVLRAIAAADLVVADIFGVTEPEGNFINPLDEDVHIKAVYVCRRAAA